MTEQIEIEISTDETLCECDHCGTSVPQDDMSTVNVGGWRLREQTWCDSCVEDTSVCDSCDQRVPDNDTQQIRTTGRRVSTWCDNCISNGDGVCTNVDTDETATSDYAQQNWYYHGNGDEEWHSEPEEEDESALHEYNCNVIEEHGWPRITKRDSLCFGVELEFETTVSRSDVIDSLGGRDGNGTFILKSDGSLDGERGVELVTLPYTLDAHASSFDWSEVLRPLQRRARSGSGTTACGMHVHVNRRALTPLQIGKALVFLNCDANSRFVTYVAQRSGNGYASRDSDKKVCDAKYTGCSRYDMLNISGRGTVEFRLFRGNLRPERVLKNIEFCHALLTYCATASVRDIEMFAPFCDWLAKRSRTYPHLTRYLRDGSYLVARRPIPERFALFAGTAAVVDA